MGETAAKLRLVFQAIAETHGMFLFDELTHPGAGGGPATTSERSVSPRSIVRFFRCYTWLPSKRRQKSPAVVGSGMVATPRASR